jgi:hypothetical protein
MWHSTLFSLRAISPNDRPSLRSFIRERARAVESGPQASLRLVAFRWSEAEGSVGQTFVSKISINGDLMKLDRGAGDQLYSRHRWPAPRR